MAAPGATIVMGGAPPSSSGGGGAIGLFLALAVLIVCAVLGYYLYTQSHTPAPAPAPEPSPAPVTAPAEAPAPAPTPAMASAPAPAADPKLAVFAKGKALQVAEKDIGPSVQVDFGPSGVDTTKPVAYTISMFINPEKAPNTWRNLFTRGKDDGDRHPAIFFYKDSTTNIHFRHGTDNDPNFGLEKTAGALATGQYTHVAFVNDGATMSVYINGVKDANTATIDPAHLCQWGTDDTTHASLPPGNGDNGHLKIKELYMFHMALSADDIKTLSVPSAPSTTSTYTPEPITSTANDYMGIIG